MSGLDGKGTNFPNGLNVPVTKLFISSVAVTASAAELNTLKNITATTAELNAYSVNVYLADAGTAGSCYVVAPHAGDIIGLYATNYAANATTKTVLLAKIATVTVTSPAWEILVTQAAGLSSSSVPTAARTVTAGQVIEIASDGGSSTVMPMMVTILISR